MHVGPRPKKARGYLVSKFRDSCIACDDMTLGMGQHWGAFVASTKLILFSTEHTEASIWFVQFDTHFIYLYI